jgi:PleD family two-component response regulator
MTQQPKILIVEDDPDTAEMLRAYFEAQGYQILVAAWGNDAIDLCQQTVPDLIIQDIRLPDIDGYEVVRKLRKTARTSNVPIIFLTDRKAQSDKIAGLELGAVDYLTKPFDTQELRLRVRNALRRASYASLVNPVTGLPDKGVTDDRLAQLPAQDHWAAIYVAIVDLDTFSESYGFVASDDVLRAVGLILSNAMDEAGSTDDFVGHTDRASFLLVTHESKAADIRDRIAARLERAFNYFYPAKDLESGQVTAPMRAEVGAITAAFGPFRSGDEILDAAIGARKTVAASHPPKM